MKEKCVLQYLFNTVAGGERPVGMKMKAIVRFV